MPEIALSPEAITWINVVIGIVVGMAIRDIATNFVQGLLFFLDSSFKPGDQVYVDGEKAVIISIGIRKTIFRIINGRGQTWRYVSNDRIKSLKLEKVIEDREMEYIKNVRERVSDIENVLETKELMKKRES